VVNELTPTHKASGDALSELRKLRETRQKQSSAKPKRFTSSRYPSHPSTSPTTMSESSLPTPTNDTRIRGVRCVCNRTEAGRDDLLIQWCVFRHFRGFTYRSRPPCPVPRPDIQPSMHAKRGNQ
jgi:hypothetical protein